VKWILVEEGERAVNNGFDLLHERKTREIINKEKKDFKENILRF
jgi:hypothetical protein